MQTDSQHTVADELIDALAELGVQYFIGGGAGTDFPPIIEAFAKRQANGTPSPTPLTIVHEITAVAMAHGYAMVAGRPAFTMLHTTVGSANGIGGLINANRARVPLLLAAGRSPITESGEHGSRSIVIHWAQESFDQAGMLREYVKWDYELRMASQTRLAVQRAAAIAQSAPAGPAYLSLPLEVLAAEAGEQRGGPLRAAAPTRAADADIESVAELLRAAERPLLITSSVGRDPSAVATLVAFAERSGVGVVEHAPTHLNFPRDHGQHVGFDPTPLLADADLVLVLESDTPWYPGAAAPNARAAVVQIDEDPLFSNYPMRGFSTEHTLTGQSRLTLAALTERLGGESVAVGSRIAHWSAIHQQQRAAWAARVDPNAAPLDMAFVSARVGATLEDDDIAITEYVLSPMHAPRNSPGTYFNHSHAGGLGWGINAALGAKLAAPERLVVCCVGDGAYTFGAPVSTHHASAMHGLPVLFVVFNNASLNAARRAALALNPQGFTAGAETVPFTDLAPSPRYEQVCEAAGGHGEYVDDPAQLDAALARARRVVVEENRQALVNVVCA